MNTQTPSIAGFRYPLALLILSIVTPFLLLNQPSLAQEQIPPSPITPSGLHTVVSDPVSLPTGQTQYNITGGTRPDNGVNLFHSFGDFGIPTNNIANFFNETALPTSNILARVTNGNPSHILGTLQTEGFGNTSLFLVNPAGIIFGPNAQLNVGGSTHFTTADYLRLTDNALYYAAINPQADGLLSSAPVAAFGFLSQNPYGITVQGSSLAVPVTADAATNTQSGSTISLVGGNISIVADPTTGTPAALTASSGRIDLLSITSPGEVLFSSMQNGPNIIGQSFSALGTVRLEGGSTLDVSGSLAEGDGHAGSIHIRGGQLVTDASLIIADTIGDVDATTPGIAIAMQGDVTLRNGSLVLSESLAGGQSGNIEISGRTIQILDGSLVQTNSVADGLTAQAGDISLTATESIFVSGSDLFGNPSSVSSLVLGIDSGHNSGSVNLVAPSAIISNLGLIQTLTQTNGHAGDIRIAVDNLDVVNGGAIETVSSSAGSTGMITITARDTIRVVGEFGEFSPSRISHLNTGYGQINEGGISIETAQLQLSDGALLQNITTVPNGSLTTITASEAVHVSEHSSIMVVGGSIDRGSLSITSPTIILNSSEILGRTFTDRDAGAMTLKSTAGDIALLNGSRILTSTESSSGNAGLLSLDASGNVILSGGSTLESSSLNSSSGNGGVIRVQASQSVLLADQGTGILSISDNSSSGNGGAISIQASQILLSNGSTIAASSSGSGNAGNITINAGNRFEARDSSVTTKSDQAGGGNITANATDQIRLVNSQINASAFLNGGNISIDPNLVILQNSQILAQAIQGNGGNITITTPLFLADQTSFVSASSQFGLNGTVTIQSPTSNLSGSVGSLPSSMSQQQALQAQRCAALSGGALSSFIIAGRDSIPTEPGGWLTRPLGLHSLGGGLRAETTIDEQQPTTLLMAQSSEVISLRRLTPAGFLTERFAGNGSNGCRS